MENISDFLKTGDKLDKEREASFKQIEHDSSATIEGVQDLQFDSRDSRWSDSVLSGLVRWIGRTSELSLESVAKLERDVSGVKDDVADVNAGVADVKGDVVRVKNDVASVGKGVGSIKEDTEKLLKRGIKRTGYLWFFRLATLASLAILALILYRSYGAVDSIESLADNQQGSLEQLQAAVDGIFNAEGIVPKEASGDASSPSATLNEKEFFYNLKGYSDDLDKAILNNVVLPTSSVMMQKLGASLEKGNHERAIMILNAISQLQTQVVKPLPEIVTKINVEVDSQAIVEAEAGNISINLAQSEADVPCSFENPCEIERVNFNSCEVIADKLANIKYLASVKKKIKTRLIELTNYNVTPVIEFRGSADLRSAIRCPVYKDNILLSIRRAQELRKAITPDEGLLKLGMEHPELKIVESIESSIGACEEGDALLQCDGDSRSARIVMYTRVKE